MSKNKSRVTKTVVIRGSSDEEEDNEDSTRYPDLRMAEPDGAVHSRGANFKRSDKTKISTSAVAQSFQVAIDEGSNSNRNVECVESKGTAEPDKASGSKHSNKEPAVTNMSPQNSDGGTCSDGSTKIPQMVYQYFKTSKPLYSPPKFNILQVQNMIRTNNSRTLENRVQAMNILKGIGNLFPGRRDDDIYFNYLPDPGNLPTSNTVTANQEKMKNAATSKCVEQGAVEGLVEIDSDLQRNNDRIESPVLAGKARTEAEHWLISDGMLDVNIAPERDVIIDMDVTPDGDVMTESGLSSEELANCERSLGRISQYVASLTGDKNGDKNGDKQRRKSSVRSEDENIVVEAVASNLYSFKISWPNSQPVVDFANDCTSTDSSYDLPWADQPNKEGGERVVAISTEKKKKTKRDFRVTELSSLTEMQARVEAKRCAGSGSRRRQKEELSRILKVEFNRTGYQKPGEREAENSGSQPESSVQERRLLTGIKACEAELESRVVTRRFRRERETGQSQQECPIQESRLVRGRETSDTELESPVERKRLRRKSYTGKSQQKSPVRERRLMRGKETSETELESPVERKRLRRKSYTGQSQQESPVPERRSARQLTRERRQRDSEGLSNSLDNASDLSHAGVRYKRRLKGVVDQNRTLLASGSSGSASSTSKQIPLSPTNTRISQDSVVTEEHSSSDDSQSVLNLTLLKMDMKIKARLSAVEGCPKCLTGSLCATGEKLQTPVTTCYNCHYRDNYLSGLQSCRRTSNNCSEVKQLLDIPRIVLTRLNEDFNRPGTSRISSSNGD